MRPRFQRRSPRPDPWSLALYNGFRPPDAWTEPTAVDQYSGPRGRRLDIRHLPGAAVQPAGMVRHVRPACLRFCGGTLAGLECRSLIVLVRPEMPAAEMRWVVAVSFSALSLLPAVLLQVSLEDGPLLIGAGYMLSGVAVAMHFWETGGRVAALHEAALLLITVGFLALTAIAVASVALRGAARSRRGGARIAASMCLALFAMSFVHGLH